MPTRHSHGFWGVVSPQLVLMVAEQALCLLSYLHSPSLIFLRQRGLADWLGWLASKTVLSSPPHNLGITSANRHARLFTWVLGVQTHALKLAWCFTNQALLYASKDLEKF